MSADAPAPQGTQEQATTLATLNDRWGPPPMNDTRPVWISEADARMYGGGLLRAWDAAPTDPAEAVLAAIRDYIAYDRAAMRDVLDALNLLLVDHPVRKVPS